MILIERRYGGEKVGFLLQRAISNLQKAGLPSFISPIGIQGKEENSMIGQFEAELKRRSSLDPTHTDYIDPSQIRRVGTGPLRSITAISGYDKAGNAISKVIEGVKHYDDNTARLALHLNEAIKATGDANLKLEDIYKPAKLDRLYGNLIPGYHGTGSQEARKFGTYYQTIKNDATLGPERLNQEFQKVLMELGAFEEDMAAVESKLTHHFGAAQVDSRIQGMHKQRMQYLGLDSKTMSPAEQAKELEKTKRFIATGLDPRSMVGYGQVVASMETELHKSLPELRKIGMQTFDAVAAGFSGPDAVELAREASRHVGDRRGLMFDIQPGSPTRSGKNYTKIGAAIVRLIGEGMKSEIAYARTVSEEVSGAFLSTLRPVSRQAQALGAEETLAFARGEESQIAAVRRAAEDVARASYQGNGMSMSYGPGGRPIYRDRYGAALDTEGNSIYPKAYMNQVRQYAATHPAPPTMQSAIGLGAIDRRLYSPSWIMTPHQERAARRRAMIIEQTEQERALLHEPRERFGRIRGAFRRGVDIGGKGSMAFMAAPMMLDLFDPNHQTSAGKGYDKVMSNPILSNALNAMFAYQTLQMFGLTPGGIGGLRHKIPGIRRLFGGKAAEEALVQEEERAARAERNIPRRLRRPTLSSVPEEGAPKRGILSRLGGLARGGVSKLGGLIGSGFGLSSLLGIGGGAAGEEGAAAAGGASLGGGALAATGIGAIVAGLGILDVHLYQTNKHARKFIDDLVKRFKSNPLGEALKVFTNPMQYLADTQMGYLWASIEDQVKSGIGQIGNWMDHHLLGKKWANGFVHDFQDIIKNGKDDIHNAVSGTFGRIGGWVNDNLSPVMWGKNMIDSFNKSVADKKDDIKNTIMKNVTDVIKGHLGFGSAPVMLGSGYDPTTWADHMTSAFTDKLLLDKKKYAGAAKQAADALKDGGKWKDHGKSSATFFVTGLPARHTWGKAISSPNLGNWIAQTMGNAFGNGMASYKGTSQSYNGGNWKLGQNGLPFDPTVFGTGLEGPQNDLQNRVVERTSLYSGLLGGRGPYYDTDLPSASGKPTNVVLPGGPGKKWKFLGMITDPQANRGGIGEEWLTPGGNKIIFWHMGMDQRTGNVNQDPLGRKTYNARTHKWENLVAGQTYSGGTTVGKTGFEGGVNHLCIVTDANGRGELIWLTTGQMDSMARTGKGSLTSRVPRGVSQWTPLINQAAIQNNISPALVASVIQSESRGDPSAYNATSHATGLMQLLPQYFKGNLKNPTTNITEGVKYLASLLKEFGNVRDALMAYNWGPGNMESWIKAGRKVADIPKKVIDYAEGILSRISSYGGFQATRRGVVGHTSKEVNDRGDFIAHDKSQAVGVNIDWSKLAHGGPQRIGSHQATIAYLASEIGIDPRIILMAAQFASGGGVREGRDPRSGDKYSSEFLLGPRFGKNPKQALSNFTNSFEAAFSQVHDVRRALEIVMDMSRKEFDQYAKWIGGIAYYRHSVRRKVYGQIPVGGNVPITSSTADDARSPGGNNGDRGPGGGKVTKDNPAGLPGWTNVPKTPAQYYNQNPLTNPSFGTGKGDEAGAHLLFQEWQNRMNNLFDHLDAQYIRGHSKIWESYRYTAWQTAVAHAEQQAASVNKWYATQAQTPANMASYHAKLDAIKKGIQTYYNKLIDNVLNQIARQQERQAQITYRWASWQEKFFKSLGLDKLFRGDIFNAKGKQYGDSPQRFWADPLAKMFDQSVWAKAKAQFDLAVAQVNKWWASVNHSVQSNIRFHNVMLSRLDLQRKQINAQAAATTLNLFYQSRIAGRSQREQLLRVETKAPMFSTYTEAQRNTWLRRDIELIRLQQADANDKAVEQFNTTMTLVKQGAFGGPNSPMAHAQVRLAREQLKEQQKLNGQIAQQEINRATHRKNQDTSLNRVIPVRVIGHCPDGTIPTGAPNKPRPGTSNRQGGTRVNPPNPNMTPGTHTVGGRTYTNSYTHAGKHAPPGMIYQSTSSGTVLVPDPNYQGPVNAFGGTSAAPHGATHTGHWVSGGPTGRIWVADQPHHRQRGRGTGRAYPGTSGPVHHGGTPVKGRVGGPDAVIHPAGGPAIRVSVTAENTRNSQVQTHHLSGIERSSKGIHTETKGLRSDIKGLRNDLNKILSSNKKAPFSQGQETDPRTQGMHKPIGNRYIS
jgi:hypothetical protein